MKWVTFWLLDYFCLYNSVNRYMVGNKARLVSVLFGFHLDTILHYNKSVVFLASGPWRSQYSITGPDTITNILVVTLSTSSSLQQWTFLKIGFIGSLYSSVYRWVYLNKGKKHWTWNLKENLSSSLPFYSFHLVLMDLSITECASWEWKLHLIKLITWRRAGVDFRVTGID